MRKEPKEAMMRFMTIICSVFVCAAFLYSMLLAIIDLLDLGYQSIGQIFVYFVAEIIWLGSPLVCSVSILLQLSYKNIIKELIVDAQRCDFQLVDEHWVLDRNPEGIALIKGQGGQVRILSQLDENITGSGLFKLKVEECCQELSHTSRVLRGMLLAGLFPIVCLAVLCLDILLSQGTVYSM